MSFKTCRRSCNHCTTLVWYIFISKSLLMPTGSHSLPYSLSTSSTTGSTFYHYTLSILQFYINEITQHLVSCICLLSLAQVCIQAATPNSNSVLFNLIISICERLFIYPIMIVYFVSFHSFVTMSKASMDNFYTF